MDYQSIYSIIQNSKTSISYKITQEHVDDFNQALMDTILQDV